jgi:hypothetical protein
VSVVKSSACADAVIVLPGIMGTELVEKATNKTLWGFTHLGWYWRAWTTGSSLDALRVTDEERKGHTGRIHPARLLRAPAVAPLLRGVEPYTDLIEALRDVVTDPQAVLPFPYDWRLPVAHNAERLAETADDHLRMWRAHPRGSASARLVLVAHSMGGLVARFFTALLGGARDVRATITIGTPFHGSVKAIQILNSGRGTPVPLPHARLRALTRNMPGLHDLLPSYRCVTDGAGARRLTPTDVANLGGDEDLAGNAAKMHDQLAAADVAGVRAVVGVEQPTIQSLSLRAGQVVPQHWAYLPDPVSGAVRAVDRGGDETVYREAAVGGVEPLYLSQTHGALARTPEAIQHIRAVVTEETLGPWLGQPPPLGIEVPDLVAAGVPFDLTIRPLADPTAATCRILDAATGEPVRHPPLVPRDGGLSARTVLNDPGVYRVAVKGESFSAVTQLFMVVPPAALTGR